MISFKRRQVVKISSLNRHGAELRSILATSIGFRLHPDEEGTEMTQVEAGLRQAFGL
jgi:hypothetical protein